MSYRQTPGSRREQRGGRNPRSRSNTAHSYGDRLEEAPEPELPVRPSIRSNDRVVSGSRLDAHSDYPVSPVSPSRPTYGSRHQTFEGPTTIHRGPISSSSRKASIPNDVGTLRGHLRPINRINTSDAFCDPSDDSSGNSTSPDHSYRGRSVSPATSHGSAASQPASYSTTPSTGATNGRKGPPPPPPSRNKKPPPPPPMKRADFSATNAVRY
jgi:hypothetical protein